MSVREPSSSSRGRTAGFVAVVVAFWVVCGLDARAQRSLQLPFHPTNDLLLQNYSAEFPPLGPVYSSMRPAVLAAHAERLQRDAPSALETFEMLGYLERPEEAVRLLRQMISERPQDLAHAFTLVASRRHGFVPLAVGDDPLPTLIAETRGQLGRLPRADAARLEHALIFVDAGTSGASPNPARVAALRAFIDRYPGTDAALEAEVDVITSGSANRAAWIGPLEAFAAQHPGTTAAAKALSEKAFQIGSNLNRRGTDPTDAFLDALASVADLRSGRYPESRWVAGAPWLAIELRPRDPQFAPGNADRLLAAYIAFVRAHFTLPETSQLSDGVNAVVTGQMFDLFELRGEGVAGVEGVLSDLERIDARRAQYLRGAFYVSRLASEPPETRAALLQKALDTLSALAASGSGLHARRALATLGSLQYAEGDLAAARTSFAAYVAAYPNTSWSWVAAIRIGQCHQRLGDLDRAVEAYRAAATRYASVPLARDLGHAFAGRASEAASRFDEAAADYERALERWGDLRRTARLERGGAGGTSSPFAEVQGLALRNLVNELRASLLSAEGLELERARRLATSDRAAALAALEAFLNAYPVSPLVREARRLSRRTRIELAIDLTGPANGPRDETAALETLAAIDAGPWDEEVGVARIVEATVTWRRGSVAQADAIVAAALRDWQARQRTGGSPDLPDDVARDVADIRRQIFEEESQTAAWRTSFQWDRRAGPAFLVVNPHIAVQVGDAVTERAIVYPASGAGNLLFMTTDAMALLVDALTGLAVRTPSAPPARVLQEMTGFLARHLPVEMGMLGGISSFASVPNVQGVTFTDAARTQARVGIRTFSSGGILLMEKAGEGWRVTGVGGTYVN